MPLEMETKGYEQRGFYVLRVQRKGIWNPSSFVSLKTYLGGRGQYNGQIFGKRNQDVFFAMII